MANFFNRYIETELSPETGAYCPRTLQGEEQYSIPNSKAVGYSDGSDPFAPPFPINVSLQQEWARVFPSVRCVGSHVVLA